MKYIEVEWVQDNADYPVRLISEIDDQRYEVRKIELYRNGKVGIATSQVEQGDTRLSIEPIPTLDLINADGEFNAKEINRDEFEVFWKRLSPHKL